jgi:hypothetical protein
MKGVKTKGHRGKICSICRHSKFWNPITKIWECLNPDCETYDNDSY